MRRYTLWPLCALLALTADGSQGEPQRVLRMGMAQAIPPYVIAEQDRGVQVDIVRAALAQKGYRLEPVYLPVARLAQFVAAGKLDGATHMKPNVDLPGFRSADILSFKNYAITRVDPHLAALRMEDLAQLRVQAWQGAQQFLGPAYAKAVKNNRAYAEQARFVPVEMLFTNRVDVIISEGNIFRHFLGLSPLRAEPVQYHALFSLNTYHYLFVRQDDLKMFEAGLHELYHNGKLDLIFKQYAEQTQFDRSAFVPMDCHYGQLATACEQLAAAAAR